MDILIYGDTETSAALRHEVPVPIGDAFLYLETGGRRAVLTNALEEARIARAAPYLERLMINEFGRDELIVAGMPLWDIGLEVCARAVAAMGIREAAVPLDFPMALADRLRADGVELTVDWDLFTERRRHKSDAEMAGIRRAAAAALDAMEEAATMLRETSIRDDGLWHGGERLTAETVRARIRDVCARAGAAAAPDIVVRPMGPNPSIGHDPGSGPLPAHAPILIDLWPRDEQSSCWADMTRTFVRGEISDQISELHALVVGAHEQTCGAARPGVKGCELFDIVCDVFEAAGHATGRTKKPGETLREGFYHGLGHGVGLDVHEPPGLGRSGVEPLIAGDVIAVEPGLVVRSAGGVGVEDLLLITDDGSERLTGSFPYALTP
ncbi:MAG TPA: M24 family metallopeptidase [Solirubrobacteraceae bacterium]|nr:M24 family metallopeptidase [Solirubrobacteraceae bacterium]